MPMRLHRSLNCEDQIFKMKLSSDDSILMTQSGRHTLILWDTADYQEMARFTFQESIRDFALAPDLSKMALITANEERGNLCSITSKFQVFDMVSQLLEAEHSLVDVRSVVFLPSSDTIALGRLGRGNDADPHEYIDFVDLPLFVTGQSVILPEYEIPFDLVTLPRLNLLLSLGLGLGVWDLTTKTLLHHIHSDNLKVNWDITETTCFCASWQHNQVAVGFYGYGIGYKICLFDAPSWENPKWFMNDLLYPNSLSLSANGKYLAATLSDNQSARVWDTENGALIGECKAAKMSVVAFSPDNRYLITGANAPQGLSLWEL